MPVRLSPGRTYAHLPMTPARAAAATARASATERGPEFVIRPAVADWRLATRHRHVDAAARQFRRELGLPDDRPIIMSGHQAQIWHPGILAKLLALSAAAEFADAAAAWIVVDHDDNDPFSIRAPIFGAADRLAVTTFSPERPAPAAPACRQPTWMPPGVWSPPVGAQPAAPGVLSGLESIRSALASHARSTDAAAQVTEAAFQLARPYGAKPIVIMATSLSRTAYFSDLVSQMRRDPARCAEAHNRAVRQFPKDRIAPLTADGASIELPLWSIGPEPGSPRRKVFAADLDSIPVERLAPRALLLTGLLRMAGCELFIHGLGGERYDRITERWLADWLGRALAPTSMVTATLRLRVPGDWPPDASIARASWTAHRARHDPAMLDDADRAQAKQSFLEQIRSAPRRSRERAALFARLHDLLHESEHAHAESLSGLDRAAAAMRARATEAAIAGDRTWPFPLYEPEQLAELGETIAAQFR